MKKIIISLLILAVAGVASAANVPDGVTGLWRFQNEAEKMSATVGTDLVNSNPDNGAWFSGPWTSIEPGMSDGGVVQSRSWDYFTAYHGISPNGGGAYVNEYTIAIDYVQTSGLGNYNCFYQTAADPHADDGDLWVHPNGTIGSAQTGYSTMTLDPSTWHRIVLSVDNANFFRVYVDGVLYLDSVGQGTDGRFSLNDNFHLFADNSWEDQWGLVGTVAVWDHALTTDEIAPMGGWINGAATPTPLVIPEPATLVVLALGGLFIRRRK